jgi:hypothetical protein
MWIAHLLSISSDFWFYWLVHETLHGRYQSHQLELLGELVAALNGIRAQVLGSKFGFRNFKKNCSCPLSVHVYALSNHT